MKVLVVDDEPAVRSALQRALALERHDVQLAEDGQQALDALAESTVDAIVLDVMMPRVDGLEVCPRLRRVDPGGPTLAFGDLVLDRAAREVRRGTRRIDLSKTEFSLLELFLEHPRQVLTRSTLFERVWGYDFGATSNALGVYIGYLRRKTEEGGERRLLHTVRGVGYVLRDP